jgi:hypothetical protein
MKVESKKGAIAVYLPQSFCGLLTLSSKGSIDFSDLVSAQVAVLSHVDTKKQCFIGNVADSLQGIYQWSGDELEVTSGSGNVGIFYVGEPQPAEVRSNLNLFSRIFH